MLGLEFEVFNSFLSCQILQAKGSRVVLTAEARNGEIGPATEYMACGACASEVTTIHINSSCSFIFSHPKHANCLFNFLVEGLMFASLNET